MIRKQRLGWTALIVAAAAMVPAPSLAATPFTYRVLYRDCGSDIGGGNYTVYMGMRVKEFGVSGANYFRAKMKVHERASWTTPWQLRRESAWKYSNYFPNDESNYYHERETYGYHQLPIGRTSLRVQVWSSTRGLLSEKTLLTVCDWNVIGT